MNGKLVTPLYTFGDETEPPPPTPEQSASSEDGTAQVTFRVDLRKVERALREQRALRSTVRRAHRARGAEVGVRRRRSRTAHLGLRHAPPRLATGAHRPGQRWHLRGDRRDPDRVYPPRTRPRALRARRPLAVWARSLDLSTFPELTSSQRLQDAIYRLSLEELRQLVREDGALSAGAKWPGVWTRDVSLSAILSLALVAPDATRRSLMAKVDSAGRIIQDTGTGGSWPVSSDRMVWALAAWELYAATGDRDWLRQSYDIIRRSAEADLHAVRDPATGLFNGESSFEDWREQSYPRWMQPADIYTSQNLGTNAVHYAAYRVLGDMPAR